MKILDFGEKTNNRDSFKWDEK
ncbi:MAG: hypothetical protein METHAR1v1_1080005 [Methanothrix sp.]|nr:MAG: hypothetical protein METHAR1v1_1080005 [Methanothrix sp.]